MSEEYKNSVRNRFDELASSYSNSALVFIKLKRLNYIKKYIKENDKILEIGCGSGNLLKSINCKNVYGLDISPFMVEECKKVFSYGDFVAGDAENLPYENELFDKVIISEVLYYLPDLNKAISEAKRVLKKDGLLLITSLNKKYNFVKALVKLLNIGVHDNVSMSYIALKPLLNILEKDFKIQEVNAIPIKFIPSNWSLIYFICGKKK